MSRTLILGTLCLLFLSACRGFHTPIDTVESFYYSIRQGDVRSYEHGLGPGIHEDYRGVEGMDLVYSKLKAYDEVSYSNPKKTSCGVNGLGYHYDNYLVEIYGDKNSIGHINIRCTLMLIYDAVHESYHQEHYDSGRVWPYYENRSQYECRVENINL